MHHVATNWLEGAGIESPVSGSDWLMSPFCGRVPQTGKFPVKERELLGYIV